MDSVLLKLLCLWFVCVGVTVSSAETNVTMGLFSWMDGQHQQDNMTTFDEFDQAWSQCDSKNDSYVSEEEVKEILQQLQLGPNSTAGVIFGSMDLNDKNKLENRFNDYDNNNDGNITWPEFNSRDMESDEYFELMVVQEGSGEDICLEILDFDDDSE